MPKKKTITTTYHRVKTMLEGGDKRLKDNDEYLCAQYHWKEIITLDLDPDKLALKKYFQMLVDGNLTPPDRITRARRKCNQHHEHTRGRSYKPRMKKEQEVIQELRLIP